MCICVFVFETPLFIDLWAIHLCFFLVFMAVLLYFCIWIIDSIAAYTNIWYVLWASFIISRRIHSLSIINLNKGLWKQAILYTAGENAEWYSPYGRALV